MVDELWPADHERNSSFCASSTDDSLLDQILRNATTACSHTHACNPPGPDLIHTHTCYHAHTQVLRQGDDDETEKKDAGDSKPKKGLGNKEAVRKYREKKKAHAAYLEEEVRQLRALNRHLIWKLQSQSVLEAEVVRLRTLLVELKGRIDHEVGTVVHPLKTASAAGAEGGQPKDGICRSQLRSFDAGGTAIACGKREERICESVVANCVVSANGEVESVARDQMIYNVSFCNI